MMHTLINMEKDLMMMKMENDLNLLGIFKQSLTIIAKTPKHFFIPIFITFLPLFLSLLLFEILLQQTLASATQLPPSTNTTIDDISDYSWFEDYGFTFLYRFRKPLNSIKALLSDLSPFFISLSLVHLVFVHTLNLLPSIFILHHSSETYASGDPPQRFTKFWTRPIKKVNFLGALTTSLYGLIPLTRGLTVAAYLSGGAYLSFQVLDDVVFKIAFLIFYGILFGVLVFKYVEKSGICSMAVVVSVLETKHKQYGNVGLGVASGYYYGGCRKPGFLLNVVFLVWEVSLRLLCMYFVVVREWEWGFSGIGLTAGQVFGVCLGKMVKWVAFMVYVCDCRKRFLEKKKKKKKVGDHVADVEDVA